MNRIIFLSLAVITQLQCSHAAVLNRTDQYYVVQVPAEELENFRAARQQSTLQATSGLVASILNGVGPLVQNLLIGPAGQRLPLPDRRGEAEQGNQPSPTAPPQEIQIIIEYAGDKRLNSTVVGISPPPTTTTPTPTTKQPESRPQTLILNYRVKPATPPPTKKPGQILVYFRQPNGNYAQSSNPASSASSKPNSQIPNSSNSGNTNFQLPESVLTEIKNLIGNQNIQLLKVVEEAEVVPAEIPTTTEKQYFYLVLQSDEYQEFAKYTSQNRQAASQPQPSQQPPPLPQAPVVAPPLPQTIFPNAQPITTVISTSTSDPEDSTQDPEVPIRVKGDEDDDDDDTKPNVSEVVASSRKVL